MNQGAITPTTAARSTRRCRTSSRAARRAGDDRWRAGFFPAMDVVRQALPMVLTMLKMALVICIPLVLLIGTYDLEDCGDG